MASEAAPSVKATAGQVAGTATQTASHAVDTAKDAASSVTNTAEQTLREATQPVKPAVDTAKDAASSVTNTAEQTLREATQTARPAVETAKDVASSVTKTAERELGNATQPGPRAEGTETGGSAPAVSPEIGTKSATTGSASDSETRPAAARSTARADDSLRPTQRSSAGTETKPAKGNGAPASVTPASAAGGPVVKTNVTRQVRGTNRRSGQGITVHRGRALVPGPASRPHGDLVAGPSAPAPGVQPPSVQDDESGGVLSFSLPGFSWPSFLPSPVELARWLLYAMTALLTGIAVLLASGFWARHRVLKV